MAAIKVSLRAGSPTCIDCGVTHGRDAQAYLCLGCAQKRIRLRVRTPAYRRHQHRYNSKPASKLLRQAWIDRNRERVRENARLAHQRRIALRGPKVVACHTLLCAGTFIRPMGSHRQFCTDCQRIFYGPKYALTQGSDHRWRAA